MGLSRREEEIFQQIEESLKQSDPQFAERTRRKAEKGRRAKGASRSPTRGELGLGSLVMMVAGLLLAVGVLSGDANLIGLGVGGVLLGGFVVVGQRKSDGLTLEQRWERRMEQQGWDRR